MKFDIKSIWKQKQKEALAGGDQKRQVQQIASGKLTARARLDLLLDAHSFYEIDQLATSPFLPEKQYTDGVVVGFGTVNGQRVAVYSQDFTIRGGSLGKRHAEKVCKIMDMASRVGCPIVGIIDSGGARIEEGIHALEGYGAIFSRNSMFSGVVPQISVIVGPCAGGAVYSPALTDFVFMTENISQMFITGPQVIEKVLHQAITKEELGGSMVHATQSGVAHVVCKNEEETFASVRQLLSLLPSSYLDEECPKTVVFSETKKCIVPENSNQAYDIKTVIDAFIDDETFFEIQAHFADNIVVGFARVAGITIGIVANQPMVKAGTIDIDASCKAARFIRFCDSFGIPIISLVDTPGYLPGIEQEHNGIIRHGAKLLYAYATATIPKITIIVRKAFGGAYIVMGSKSLGADVNVAFPHAQIAVLGAKAAVTILHGKTLALLHGDEKKERESILEKEYETAMLNPFVAAEFGYIDGIIEPDALRFTIHNALLITREKAQGLPKRKHGNVPL